MNKKYTIYLIGFETGLPYYAGYKATRDEAIAYAETRLNDNFRGYEIREQIISGGLK